MISAIKPLGRLFWLTLVIVTTYLGPATSGLACGSSPKQAITQFLHSMNQYKQGVEVGDDQLTRQIDRALNCLDLSQLPYLIQSEKGREAAIYLKEVIDRFVPDLAVQIPSEGEVKQWSLLSTGVELERTKAGSYRFSEETVLEAHSIFQKYKKRPYKSGSGGGANYQKSAWEKWVPTWAEVDFLGSPVYKWLVLLIGFLVGFLLKVVIEYIITHLEGFTRKTQVTWDDELLEAVGRPVGHIGAVGFMWILIYALNFSGRTHWVLATALKLILSFYIIWLLYRLVGVFTAFLQALALKTSFPLDGQLIPLVARSLRVFVLVFGALVTIQNFGIEVMSVMAGLGLGGLAFALAAKDTAANLFGSLMILLDRPFKVGDWIASNDVEGTVEDIGLRSTLVRTFYDSLVSIPNAKLANQNIDNMGLRRFRRVFTHIEVKYNTRPVQMEAFLEGLKNIILANPATRKENFHVVFSGYKASGLAIMIYFFLDVPDWAHELKQRQNVYLEILRLAQHLQIEFAYPTQTLHIESMAEASKSLPMRGFRDDELASRAMDFSDGGALARPEGLGIFTAPFEHGGDRGKSK